MPTRLLRTAPRPVTGQNTRTKSSRSGHLRPDAEFARFSHAQQSVRRQLNQLLADTMTLRDFVHKKHHWQVAGLTFYQSLDLLFDKHYNGAEPTA